MKNILLISFLLLVAHYANGQQKLTALIENENFNWTIKTVGPSLFIYLEKDRYPEQNKSTLIGKIQHHIESTCEFLEIKEYEKDIHYFVVENRAKMSLLLGYETNGGANYKENYVTAIFSNDINSVGSNHELFHLMAMNLWGKTELWLNEGMAVYSDNNWRGYDLHEISKYLIDNNKFIPIKDLSKRLRKYDSMVTYPLLGSFVKFIDHTNGRETIKAIWKNRMKIIRRPLGKSLVDLEQEWLEMLTAISYKDIEYLK